jgi:hypothetical protein
VGATARSAGLRSVTAAGVLPNEMVRVERVKQVKQVERLEGRRVRPVALVPSEWVALSAAHDQRVDVATAEHRERRGSGRTHPVEDFLFTYYSFTPGRLRRWHPGGGRALVGAGASERLAWRWYAEVAAVDGAGSVVPAVGLDLAAYLADRGDLVGFVRDLLTATASRPAALGCFGLHEWAMVYRRDPAATRHSDWPLRLGEGPTDAVVEQQAIRCTHYDAFRFFTPESLGRNVFQPSRESQVALEQPGCLHANMDLYKWAYKLGPLVPGELLLACFELARDVRVGDMRASPYDLTALGYSPIPIETPEGRAEYVAAQRSFAQRGAVLRQQLIAVCEHVRDRELTAGHRRPVGPSRVAGRSAARGGVG